MIKKISSSENIKIKYVKRLVAKSSFRKSQNKFILEGKRMVLDSDKNQLDMIFVSENLLPNFNIEASETPIFSVKDDIFKSISDTKNSQGIIAVANICDYSAQIIDMAKVVLYLDGIADPGNMGTIIRTAEASGADLIILSKDCVDIYNPKVVRATMGSILRQPIICDEDGSMINKLKDRGFNIVVTKLHAQNIYNKHNYGDKVAIVMGSEANGVRENILQMASSSVSIPMKGNIESLNVAIAAAVILFHVSSMR